MVKLQFFSRCSVFTLARSSLTYGHNLYIISGVLARELFEHKNKGGHDNVQ